MITKAIFHSLNCFPRKIVDMAKIVSLCWGLDPFPKYPGEIIWAALDCWSNPGCASQTLRRLTASCSRPRPGPQELCPRVHRKRGRQPLSDSGLDQRGEVRRQRFLSLSQDPSLRDTSPRLPLNSFRTQMSFVISAEATPESPIQNNVSPLTLSLFLL